ncbi:DNA-binding transcriptional regulator, GntR family [Mesorhizobium albiziae]|uniref:DNA-binding transcriptional regulator, GntR family n=1 Tax=Neomesorhizobium albiziae TaxID=335020 RepID=A0A1I3Y7V8_9HYPH|nr:GntR family transcriptional regulator [Mesorhizobium albiziae]GLS30057.1 GntR family transcriptional regulator [Mesorhizobium albiziae]SFK27479.1 DNA-binding transcriptional regulator, GntR family [Mesorhizobium albiziae]
MANRATSIEADAAADRRQTGAPALGRQERTEQLLGDRMLSRIRADILSLKLAPGEVISERALQANYGASRTPIRQALMHLIREGLILRTTRGYAVTPFDLDELDESFEYRELIEDAAIRLACARAQPGDLDAMQETIDRGLTEFTPESWFEIGLDVHVRLAELSGNRFLRDAVQDVIARTMRVRWLVSNTVEGREAAHRDHSEIVRLVRDRNADAAAKALRHHGREVRRQIYDAINSTRRFLGVRSFAGGRRDDPGEHHDSGRRDR